MTEREEFLEDALQHILRTAQNSRTRTKRLAWIEKRCQESLDGIPYDRDNFDLPVMKTLTPIKYEEKIKDLKREIEFYKGMSLIQRIKFLFKGATK